MALSMAKVRARQSQVDWRRQLPLAGGTLLLMLGLFCAWQTYLIADEATSIEHVHAAQDQALQVLAAEIAAQRGKVQKAVHTIDPATAMADPAKTVEALKRQLPQSNKLEIYSGDMSEVLRANYHDFGYAKAAQLMTAKGADGLAHRYARRIQAIQIVRVKRAGHGAAAQIGCLVTDTFFVGKTKNLDVKWGLNSLSM